MSALGTGYVVSRDAPRVSVRRGATGKWQVCRKRATRETWAEIVAECAEEWMTDVIADQLR